MHTAQLPLKYIRLFADPLCYERLCKYSLCVHSAHAQARSGSLITHSLTCNKLLSSSLFFRTLKEHIVETCSGLVTTVEYYIDTFIFTTLYYPNVS